jgi:mannose-6-phosphate isomerase-like protein (cupin superfamily)
MKVVNIKDIEVTKAFYNPKIKKQIILSSGELGNIVSFAQAVIPPGEVSKAHSHQNMGEVFLVLSGTGIIIINDVKFELKKNLCAVVEPNEVHEIENTGEDDLSIIYFEITINSQER